MGHPVKVKNTPPKVTDGKGKFKRMLSFLLQDKGRLFCTKLSFKEFEIFFTATGSEHIRGIQRTNFAKQVRNVQNGSAYALEVFSINLELP